MSRFTFKAWVCAMKIRVEFWAKDRVMKSPPYVIMCALWLLDHYAQTKRETPQKCMSSAPKQYPQA